MIGSLNGTLIDIQPPEILLDVAGVGYEITVPMSTFYVLPTLNEKVRLFIHMSVREDAHTLFGFATKEEKKLFRTLIKVNGVGPKLAITILSGISVHEFVRVINDNNIVGLTKLPGVGKKTAERLVIEVKDKLKEWADMTQSNAFLEGETVVQSGPNYNMMQDEAEAALISLGYKPQEATKVLARLRGQANNVSDLIKLALQSMA